MEWFSCWPVLIDSTSSPSPLPRGQSGGAESSNPLITLLVLQASSPILRCGPKLTSGHLYLSSLTKFRGFWELWARNCRQRPNIFKKYFGHLNGQVRVCLVTQSCPTLCHPMACSLPGSSVHVESLGRNNGVGSHTLLQGIFPSQGLNPGLPHCRWVLSCLSHQGSPWHLPGFTQLLC